MLRYSRHYQSHACEFSELIITVGKPQKLNHSQERGILMGERS